ncbi:MAG: copper amine oxidase N-terminal domain-containing protein [Peptococcaceae bacterium]|nr:copper amine oxidase N-terminal domain-containing protein [Peptococcaceae bacterium]
MVALDTPAVITNGRTMVPLSAVASGLGLDVFYDAENRSVIIVQPELNES